MKRLIRVSLMISLLVATSSVCRAEPSPAVRYLIDTPVSMLDFGIYRIEKHLEESLKSSGYRGVVTVSYSLARNRITISLLPLVHVQGDPGPQPYKFVDLVELKNEDEAKVQCKRFVGVIRERLGSFTSTGKSLITGDHNSVLKVFFSHEGYKDPSQSKNLFEEVDNITEISVSIPFYAKEREFVHAGAKLLGTEILFVND